MISQKTKLKCTKCNKKETRTIGDCLPDANMLKPCKSCGGLMTFNSDEKEDILEKILNIFKK